MAEVACEVRGGCHVESEPSRYPRSAETRHPEDVGVSKNEVEGAQNTD